MRGGVTYNELLHCYSHEERVIINKIIGDNIELTKKNGISIL